MRTVRVLARPSGPMSRSRVMRLAPFAWAPAKACTQPMMRSFGRLIGSPGPLDSTTSTSPFGST